MKRYTTTNNDTIIIEKQERQFFVLFAFSFEKVNNKNFEPYFGNEKTYKGVLQDTLKSSGLTLKSSK